MSSFYQVFDLRSGNLVADFASECEAWAWLRQVAAEHGREELDDLGLLHMQDDQPTLVAMEKGLVTRALRDDDDAELHHAGAMQGSGTS